MILVDTNILAQVVFDTTRTYDAMKLLKLDPEWHSEHFILIELINVLSKQVRGGYVTFDQAHAAFSDAEDIVANNLHSADDHAVLEASVNFKITAYDARYIALAKSLGVRLITEDRRLRNAAPNLTESLDEAIARLQQ